MVQDISSLYPELSALRLPSASCCRFGCRGTTSGTLFRFTPLREIGSCEVPWEQNPIPDSWSKKIQKSISWEWESLCTKKKKKGQECLWLSQELELDKDWEEIRSKLGCQGWSLLLTQLSTAFGCCAKCEKEAWVLSLWVV